ncbi:MAG TPA: hypothetical protein VL356_09010 [Acidocella sp.]|jgi:hypothetical protein|nr:hypothetical protein [Acidocella sp.]
MIAHQLYSRFVWRKESGRFLKKAAQKLFFCWAMGGVGDNAHGPEQQSFFASFCSQKEAFLFRFMPASPAGRLP